MTAKPRKSIPKVSAKRLAANPELARQCSTIPRSSSQQGGPKKSIRKVNPVAKAKRTARFKKYLSSAAWKKLRLAVFERDGFQCVASYAGFGRCPYFDVTRTGEGLVCDHLTYARFGHENLDDLRTLCRSCNALETTLHRANWTQGRRSSSYTKGHET